MAVFMLCVAWWWLKHQVVEGVASSGRVAQAPFFILFVSLVTLVTDPSAPPGTVLILTLIARSLRLNHATGEATWAS